MEEVVNVPIPDEYKEWWFEDFYALNLKFASKSPCTQRLYYNTVLNNPNDDLSDYTHIIRTTHICNCYTCCYCKCQFLHHAH